MSGRIELLGRIGVHREGVAGGTLPGRRAELVFAYLVAEHHRVVSQDELADALWPETLPDSWAAALRGVISEVRRHLEDAGLDPAEVLTTVRRGYQIRLPDDVVVDLDEARDGLARARSLLEAGAGAGAAVHAARSAALARLPFLPHLDGDWVDGIRRELESMHVRALEVEARAHQAAGDLTAAAAAAERLVRADPFSEAGHQLRIRILGEAGDRAGAIRAYEHCRAVLAEELGVEPSAETDAARRLAVEPRARPEVAAPPAPPAGPAPAPAGLGDLSVLVIEDHDFQRRTAVRLLNGIGVATVADAADGAAALELLASKPPPDVIICDIDMPGMDGVQFINRVAERGLASAVVIASGLDVRVLEAVKTVGETHGLQVLGALEKPLTARRLAELLGTYRRQRPQPAAGDQVTVTVEEVVTALGSRELATLFEPMVDLSECRVSGAEAVGSWVHPSRGPVPPGVFLPVLAREGLAVPYAEARLADACDAASRCRAAGLSIGIGMDIGPYSLGDVTLADRLADTVRGAGGEPSLVTCEVSEQTLAGAPPSALDVMTRLRVKGFGLALDHYGTRRISPERLGHIPFTQVKVDGSLAGGASPTELEETFEGARALGLPVVGTGCRSEADFELMVDVGFRYVQGPCIASAMSGQQLAGWAATWTPPGAGA